MKNEHPSVIQISKISRTVLFFLLLTGSFLLATAKELNDRQVENVFDHQQVENIIITIQDDAPLHVHPEGKLFSIRVKVDSPYPSKIFCQWYDFRGYPLSEPIKLVSGRGVDVLSPSSTVGYYGLVFKSNDSRLAFSNRQIGENREYGFTIIKPRAETARLTDADSPFGVVHARLYDPFLPPWIKTLTWKTFSAKHWKQQIEKRQQQLGVIELPLIVGYEWDSDDSQEIPPAQLEALGSRIKQYFEAQPNLLYWELGLEENIKKRFKKDHYWDNLEKKVRTVREAANGVNPKIKLIYQIAGLNIKSIKKFSKSKAAKVFDIISLHPYAWPNFIDPELWLIDYLKNARLIMKEHELEGMPIWFTEVGVP
ncbi:MAG: hypothetical protein KAR12_09080, partial [Methylococcales bacterium]|nr:hypothetical protein [Methylococcales bacterium]